MDMKAATLLFTRITTGAMLIIWGFIKIGSAETGVRIATKYYGSFWTSETLQMPWGIFQVVVGALVILGLFRKYIYPLQAIILCLGAAAIWQYILDPLGLYLLDESSRNTLFFPSIVVAAATLILIAFKEFDTLSLDNKISKEQ